MISNVRKPLLLGSLVIVLVSVLTVGILPGYAQTATPAPSPQGPPTATPLPTSTPVSIPSAPDVAQVTFQQLGQQQIVLTSPSSQFEFSFELPYRWKIEGGADTSYIEIQYDMIMEGGALSTPAPGEQPFVPSFTTYFDGLLVSSLQVAPGRNQVIRVPIPADLINLNPSSSFHSLTFWFDVGRRCMQVPPMRIVIHNSSFLRIKYSTLPLELDLADFPRPVIQNPLSGQPVLIVLPDVPNDTDLSAAAGIAAVIGDLTFGVTRVEVAAASQVTFAQMVNRGVIIVGQPGANAMLADLYRRNRLPTTLSREGVILDQAGAPIAAEDGVLQEMVSEADPEQVYLIVTGNSDRAVSRAARALSAARPRYGFSGRLVLIQDYNEAPVLPSSISETFTLADQGFTDAVFTGVSTFRKSVTFFVPSSWAIESGAALTLHYVHSAALDPETSVLTVELNGEPVGSAPLDAQSTSEAQVVIQLPPGDFRPGERNRISFEVTNHLADICAPPDSPAAWTRVMSSSVVYLPHVEVDGSTNLPVEDPLTAFASRHDLGDVWFSLPAEPTLEEIRGMLTLAWRLGSVAGGPGFMPRASRGPITDTAQLADYHLIVVGRPSANPLLASLNDSLPQPFVAGEDRLQPVIGQVIYRLPDDFSIGIFQFFPSPWNPNRVVLALTGTTQEGENWLLQALSDDTLFYILGGHIAFVLGDQIEVIDLREQSLGAVVAALGTVVPTVEGTPILPMTMTPPPTLDPSAAVPDQYAAHGIERPAFVTIAVIALVGLGVVVTAAGIIITSRRNRTQTGK